MFEVLKTEGKARRGVFTCAHGTVQTPVFMNVGTQGAIKGAVSAHDLKEIGCQVELSNTYHLHLRPGDQVVRQMGGLHRFMRLGRPDPDRLAAGSRCSPCRACGRSRRKGSPSPPTSTGAASLWGRRSPCRFSPTWAPISPWPSTSAWKTRRPMSMPKPPASAPCAGWPGARRSTTGSTPCLIR